MKKYPVLEISDIPYEVVATIAASLSTRKTHPIEALELAYEFLRCAKAAQQGKRDGISVRDAVREDSKRQFREFQESIKGKIQPRYADDDLGGKKPLPVDFSKAFTEVIGTSKEVKADQKLHLFRHFLMALQRIDLLAAGEVIAKWKSEGGMPWAIFKEFRNNFQAWKKGHDGVAKSDNAKKGKGIPRKRKPRMSKATDPKVKKILEIGREIARVENSTS